MTPERIKELRALADDQRMSTEFAGAAMMPVGIGLNEALDAIERVRAVKRHEFINDEIVEEAEGGIVMWSDVLASLEGKSDG